MYLIRLVIAVAILTIFHQEAGAQGAPNLCTETDRTKLLAVLALPSGQETAPLVPAFSRAPAGAPAELVLDRPNDPKLTFRIVFQLGDSATPSIENVRVLENRDISAKPVSDKYFLKVSGAVAQGSALLSFEMPQIVSGGWPWQGGMITVIACDEKSTIKFQRFFAAQH